MAGQNIKEFDYDKLVIGEELGSYEYVLTQEMLDNFRAAVDDPEASFPTLAVKHDATAFAMVYEDNTGGVNAGNEVEFFNPPIPGKTTLESNGLKFAITHGNDVKTNPVTLGRFSKIFALYLEIRTGLGRIKNGFALTGGRDINGSNNGRKENKFFHNVQVLGAHPSNMPRTGKAQK